MNTKFFFALLVIVIALVATACAPDLTDSSAPIDPVQPANNETTALIPVTGASAANEARTTQEPRLWSGEVFFSANSNPDYVQNVQPAASQVPQNTCLSEDSQPRRQSGCIE